MMMQYIISVMNPVNNFKSYRLLIDSNNPRFIACLEVLLKDLLYEFEKHENVMSPTRTLIAHRSSSSFLRAGLTGDHQYGEFKSSVTINLAPTVIVDTASHHVTNNNSNNSPTNSNALSSLYNNEQSGSPPDSPKSDSPSPLNRSFHVARDDGGDSSSADDNEIDDSVALNPNAPPNQCGNAQQLSTAQKKKLFLVKNEKKHFRRSKILKDINLNQNERERHQSDGHANAVIPRSSSSLQSHSPPHEQATQPPHTLSETNTTTATEGGGGVDDSASTTKKISSSKEKLIASGSSSGGAFIKLSLSPRTSPREDGLSPVNGEKTPDRSLRKSVEISNNASVLINSSPPRGSDERENPSAHLSNNNGNAHANNTHVRQPSPVSPHQLVVVAVGYDPHVIYNCAKLMQIGQLISLAAKCQEFPEDEDEIGAWLDPTLLAFLLAIPKENYDTEGIERLMRKMMDLEKPEKEREGGKEKAKDKDKERDREAKREEREKRDEKERKEEREKEKDDKEVTRDRRSK
jgi:hypothetical protein